MNGSNKAWFLDRDGTIIEDRHYLSDPDQIYFLPNAVEALRIAQADGYLLIVVTNQSGIGRGYFTENTADLVDRRFRELLLEKGVTLTDCLRCPHYPQGIPPYNVECTCRKPETGLFSQAISKYDIIPEQCLACGDKPRDIQRLPELGIPVEHTGIIGTKDGEFADLLAFYGYVTQKGF